MNRIAHKSGPAATADDATIELTLSGHQFEELLERDERIFVIETQDLQGTLSHFNNFARQSGKAVYLWQPDNGLRSLKVSEMGVPGSERLAEAFRYIANSPHYGIYAFSRFERQIDPACSTYLERIVRARGGYDRKLFLVSDQVNLPRIVQRLALRIIHRPSRRLRLRDGRWVVS